MRINEFLSARDLRKSECGIRSRVQSSDMCDHDCGIDPSGSCELEGLDHIRCVSARRSHDVRGVIVDVIEIHRRRELRICRTCEEIQTSVTSQDRARLCDDRSHRCVAEDIVIARAACKLAEICDRIVVLRGIHEMKFNAFLLKDLLRREELFGPVQSVLIDVCDRDHAGLSVAMDRIGQSSETHRAGACRDRHLSALFDAHLVCIDAHLCVISRIHSSDRAGQRLCEGCLVISFSLILKEAVTLEKLSRKDAVCCVTAAELIRVTRAPHRSLVIQGRLDRELHSRLILISIFCADLHDIARELMSHDRRMLRDVVMYSLVVDTEDRALVSRHADRIGNDLYKHLIFFDLRKFELIKPKIICRVESDSLCFHLSVLL